MPTTVLITQCLQRDFIEPVASHDALPNALHVGRSEAVRLMGHEPQAGPVAQIMFWARNQPDDQIEVVHIRDWHDNTDPRQLEHLDMFGHHCIADSEGAALVLELDDEVAERDNEHLVNCIGLNDFEDTTLATVLNRIRKNSEDGQIRVGVIGVWTEAKVSFLLYDLKTRGHVDEIATCSALTASASRAQHFNALDQLTKVLGVEVFDTIGDFADWMRPGSVDQVLSERPKGYAPAMTLTGDPVDLVEGDQDVLNFLYRDAAKVELETLIGGYSGAYVFRASSHDSMGHDQAPSVAKIGPRSLIGAERTAFEKVEEILGNSAPSVRGFVDLGERAGIKYSYAAMGRGDINTFQSLYEGGLELPRIEEILREVFEDILAPFYSAAQYERLPMLEHYTFAPGYGDRVRSKVVEVYGPGGDAETLVLPDGSEIANVTGFYDTYVSEHMGAIGEYHYVSYVHGDLNGANILVDARDNLWIIDFFHTSRGHVLKDLLKLENDLLYIFAKISNEAELEEAMIISRALTDVNDLRAPLPKTLPGLETECLVRAWATLRILRSIGARFVREDRNPMQVLVPLVRYAVHTLGFYESNDLQKRWALATACLMAERIQNTTSENRELRVAWIEKSLIDAPGRLGMTLCPGRKDHGRVLGVDLDALKDLGVKHIYGLLTDTELDWAGVPDIHHQCESRGIAYRRLPIPDQGVPTMAEAVGLCAEINTLVDEGEDVVIHCVGGLGRTGTIAACALVNRGASSEQAIVSVRKGRGPRAVESESQSSFVEEYARHVRMH